MDQYIFITFAMFFYIYSSYTVLLRCRGLFVILWIFTQSVGLLGRVIGPSQDLYLNTGQHKHRITHTHTPNIHAQGGVRTHDHSVRASEDT
jgi:hypothetical protein